MVNNTSRIPTKKSSHFWQHTHTQLTHFFFFSLNGFSPHLTWSSFLLFLKISTVLWRRQWFNMQKITYTQTRKKNTNDEEKKVLSIFGFFCFHWSHNKFYIILFVQWQPNVIYCLRSLWIPKRMSNWHSFVSTSVLPPPPTTYMEWVRERERK